MKTNDRRGSELDSKSDDNWQRIEDIEGKLDSGKLDAEMARVQTAILKERIKQFAEDANRERLHRKAAPAAAKKKGKKAKAV